MIARLLKAFSAASLAFWSQNAGWIAEINAEQVKKDAQQEAQRAIDEAKQAAGKYIAYRRPLLKHWSSAGDLANCSAENKF